MPKHITDIFEDKARAGDGSFAIAFALMEIAREQKRVGYALERLGLGDAATPMGALEALSVNLGESVDWVASAIQNVADRD